MNGRIKKTILGIVDICILPLTAICLPILRRVRKHGVNHFPYNRKLFLRTGVFPILDHYYEPQLVYSKSFDAEKKRPLHLDFKLEKQLAMLSSLQHGEEMKTFPLDGDPQGDKFYIHNPSFGPGDCDLYYLLVRNLKPRRIIEVGSGFSTLICKEAIEKNLAEGVHTELICIEPFEKPWLEKQTGIRVLRESVEKISLDVFDSLEENDILFIDSSHIIRPENDVLFEYLEILPRLKKGVVIHVHDIFSPRHYRKEWLQEEFRFWNEQYLLEAFLYYNDHFEILFAANHLKKDAFDKTKETLTTIHIQDEPASFWMRKIK